MSEVKYSKEHEWIKLEGDTATIGITKHATEMLGDIVFTELPEKGSNVEKDGTAGVVESIDSTTPAVPSFSTLEPFSGSSVKTMSPNISVACFVIPIVAVSPSSLIHSCSFEYLTSLIGLLLSHSFFYKMVIHKYLLDVFFL